MHAWHVANVNMPTRWRYAYFICEKAGILCMLWWKTNSLLFIFSFSKMAMDSLESSKSEWSNSKISLRLLIEQTAVSYWRRRNIYKLNNETSHASHRDLSHACCIPCDFPIGTLQIKLWNLPSLSFIDFQLIQDDKISRFLILFTSSRINSQNKC